MERRMERRDRERQKERGRSADGSRTPIAWQQRDMNYQQFSIGEIDHTTASALSSDRMSHPSLASRSGYSQGKYRRSSSNNSRGKPATLSDEDAEAVTSTETETETESDSQFDRPHPSASRPGTSGTMRSFQSMTVMAPLQLSGAFTPVPGGLVPVGYGMVGMGMGMPSIGAPPSHTWDGEPCPVHGSSLTNIPAMLPPSYPPMPVYNAPPMLRAPSVHDLALAQSLYGPLPRLPPTPKSLPRGPPSLPPLPPPNLLPPLQRPRPLVVSEKGETEHLPIRSNGEAAPLPSKLPLSSESNGKAPSGTLNRSTVSHVKESKCLDYNSCCKGNVVVLWCILGVIAFGIVLGVVLHFAFG